MANTPAFALTTISGGINRLRTKGGADKNSLYDLLNGYVTQASTVKVRPGTFRNANIAAYSGVGNTKGLLAYQSQLHVFSASVVPVPPGYALHVLNYPAAQSSAAAFLESAGTFAASTRIGTNVNAGLVSASVGYALQAIINPVPTGNVGSITPTTAFGATIAGFFQTTAASPSDPNTVYLVLSATPMIPPSGVTVSYPNAGGITSVALSSSNLTTILGLGANYAVYTLGTVTPVGDPLFSGVGALFHFDGSLANSAAAGGNGTAVSGATIDTAAPAFGTGALNLGTAVDKCVTYPTAASGPLDISTGNFTVEGWFKTAQAIGTGFSLVGDYDQTSSTGWNVTAIQVGGQISVTGFITIAGATYSAAIGAAFTPVIGTWYAFSFVRNGNSITTYINGVGGPATVLPAGAGRAPTGTLTIGALSPSYARNNNGEIDEIRITKGIARYTANYTPAGPFPGGLAPTFNNQASYPIKEIHFSAPYLGGIYVVAEFVVDAPTAALYGTVFHYWIQSSNGGDNSNAWKAKADYKIGDVVIPTVPNGLTFIASRRLPANPVWTPNTAQAVNNVVEPVTANGFQYAATAVLGANPTTGAVEPTWPVVDGGVVNENSALAVDQTITLATAANAVATPTTPTRYVGIAGGFKSKA